MSFMRLVDRFSLGEPVEPKNYARAYNVWRKTPPRIRGAIDCLHGADISMIVVTREGTITRLDFSSMSAPPSTEAQTYIFSVYSAISEE